MEMLEQVRRRLRDLVQFMEKRSRNVLFTDFEDEIGEETSFELLGLTPAQSIRTVPVPRLKRFCTSIRITSPSTTYEINKPLTYHDLEVLEYMLSESRIGDPEAIAIAKEESQGLGLFVRSLIGLDRGAAKEAFAEFLDGRTFSANQIGIR